MMQQKADAARSNAIAAAAADATTKQMQPKQMQQTTRVQKTDSAESNAIVAAAADAQKTDAAEANAMQQQQLMQLKRRS
jgi:hypothetical protein